jgi:hypothetical protein
MTLAKARRLALRVNTFIIQASIMIVTYDRQNIFIVQATGVHFIKLFFGLSYTPSSATSVKT